MLQIAIPGTEMWDEEKQEFLYPDDTILCLEHSLVSLSKWESIWHKSFLFNEEKSYAETISYIKCMTLNENVDQTVYSRLTNKHFDKIRDYIQNPMTATTFRNDTSKHSNEVVTAELIYYWMITLGIPYECRAWHLNKLLTLIRLCNIKNGSSKKMSKREIASQNAALNAARRQRMKSKG